MKVGDRQPPRRLGIAIGHAQDDDLIQPEDVAYARFGGERVDQRQLGRARIAEDELDPLAAQQVEE